MRSTNSIQQVNARINGGFKNGPQERGLRDSVPWALFARTTADNTYNNTAALAAISELTLDVESGRVYEFEGFFGLSIAAAANNIQIALDGGTATAALIEGYYQFLLTAVAPTQARISALTTDIDGGATNAWTGLKINGLLVVNAGGKLIVRASQAAAAATNSIIRAGSYLKLTEVG